MIYVNHIVLSGQLVAMPDVKLIQRKPSPDNPDTAVPTLEFYIRTREDPRAVYFQRKKARRKRTDVRIRIECTGNIARFAANRELRRGDGIIVIGHLRESIWSDRYNAQKKKLHYIEADRICFLPPELNRNIRGEVRVDAKEWNRTKHLAELASQHNLDIPDELLDRIRDLNARFDQDDDEDEGPRAATHRNHRRDPRGDQGQGP